MKSLSSDLHHVSKLYTWYDDPSSNGFPDILFTRLLFHTKRQSRKREIIQSNIYRILQKNNQVIYTLDTFCMPNIMTLAQAVLQIFCSQGPLLVKCLSEKRNNSVKFWQNFMKSLSGDVHHIAKLYAWHHYPSSSYSPNILFTRLLYCTKWQSQKREIIQSSI